MLWNVSAGVGFGLFSGSTSVADHGKYAVRFDDGYWYCWDLNSGNKLWKGALISWPDGEPLGVMRRTLYGGMIISNQYDGVAAYNWTNGKIVWFYQAKTQYSTETPYEGDYRWFSMGYSIIADGKLFTYNSEHTAGQPITRGWRLHAINITTGEGIWNITGSMAPTAVADGYLIAGNAYDGYMYVFGKGKSATTVSAPQTTVTSGIPVLIQGTVLDQSPAQPGTPCVSAGSMATYMEYLHMQKPIPSNFTVTGVPVQLLAIDPNGNAVNIGTATSDVSGNFQYEFTPTIDGVYKITATFTGDDAYGISWAETGLSVGVVPQASQTETAIATQTDYTMTIIAAAIGLAFVVVISVAIAVMILKKR